jgi:hypothetical protein
MYVPRVIGTLKPVARRIPLAEACVNQRGGVGRNIPFSRDGFQCDEFLLTAPRAARLSYSGVVLTAWADANL